MLDQNAASTDPALVMRADIVKRMGPMHVDYAYQAVAVRSDEASLHRESDPEAFRNAIRSLFLKSKAN